MSLARTYDPHTVEPTLQTFWQEAGTCDFSGDDQAAIYAIDTPPPTVSGILHMGHIYSYSQTDFIARFWRMNGLNVFYPMGYDDNGLPTERLVEKRLGIRAPEIGRTAFIGKCLEVSEEAEREYQRVWRRLGLSIDWHYSYRTIDDISRRTSQLSFMQLFKQGRAYRQEAPSIWCPECQTALAQAELNDLDRETTFYTLAFRFWDGTSLPVATTRPELLPACVAIFVNPNDTRYTARLGQMVITPLGDTVPLFADEKAHPEKGTGAVMCCTFGDTTDIEWWREYSLTARIIIGRDGRLTTAAGKYSGLSVGEARAAIVDDLQTQGVILGRYQTTQSVRVHERDDVPVEYIVTSQWFIRVLEERERFLDAGDRVSWHPAEMQSRYRAWVENLKWDWCISRSRYFGVPFPVWYCTDCGEIMLADESELPVDPTETEPSRPCACGAVSFRPEEDVMDTWATSSMSPQIVGRWLLEPALYNRIFPFKLRSQAHEIIRTWAFDTIVKSLYHFDTLPWSDLAISGWGLAPEGMGKLSKSRGAGSITPDEAFTKYSTDAVRYWAASTSFGKDSIISEEKMQVGMKLVTKLWNVARFSERFLSAYAPPVERPDLEPADRWILSRAQRLTERVTDLFRSYEYAAAKSEAESFFWTILADNYVEMAKARLYDTVGKGHDSAQYTLYQVLLTILKVFAPFLPHITEQVYHDLFAKTDGSASIHRSHWPEVNEALVDGQADDAGDILVEVATAIRRYKSEHGMGLGEQFEVLHIATKEFALARLLTDAEGDVRSVTRARRVKVQEVLPLDTEIVRTTGRVSAALQLQDNAD